MQQVYYSPVFFDRVGLRYINAIQREKLGLSHDVPWKRLIGPLALGFLSDDTMLSKISGFSSVTEVKEKNGAVTRIVTALGQVKNNGQTTQHKEEISFIIDTDSFFGKTNINDAIMNLDKLHQVASEVFQSMITEELQATMEPMMT